MKNFEKYATAKEAWKVYKEFCKNDCQHCPMMANGRISCIITWLYADDNNGKPTPQWQNNLMDKFTSKE